METTQKVVYIVKVVILDLEEYGEISEFKNTNRKIAVQAGLDWIESESRRLDKWFQGALITIHAKASSGAKNPPTGG